MDVPAVWVVIGAWSELYQIVQRILAHNSEIQILDDLQDWERRYRIKSEINLEQPLPGYYSIASQLAELLMEYLTSPNVDCSPTLLGEHPSTEKSGVV